MSRKDPLKTYAELKEEVAQTKTERDRAEGALERALKDLATEFDVSSVKIAKKLLDELTRKAERQEAAFAAALEEFEKDNEDVG